MECVAAVLGYRPARGGARDRPCEGERGRAHLPGGATGGDVGPGGARGRKGGARTRARMCPSTGSVGRRAASSVRRTTAAPQPRPPGEAIGPSCAPLEGCPSWSVHSEKGGVRGRCGSVEVKFHVTFVCAHPRAMCLLFLIFFCTRSRATQGAAVCHGPDPNAGPRHEGAPRRWFRQQEL